MRIFKNLENLIPVMVLSVSEIIRAMGIQSLAIQEFAVDINYFLCLYLFMMYLVAILCLLPVPACAGNLNIPTIVLTERLMLASFILIVVLEAGVILKYLSGLTKKQAFFISLKSNLITMLLVVPLVWGIWSIIIWNVPKFLFPLFQNSLFKNSFVQNIITAPLIVDTQSILLAEWVMAPVYFYVSYRLEYWFSLKKLAAFEKSQARKAFFYANFYSYLMIMAFETICQIIITPYKALNPYLF